MSKTYLVKKTLAGWYLIQKEMKELSEVSIKTNNSKCIDAFPVFIDPEYGALLDTDGDSPFFMNAGWEIIQFTPAPPGCYGYFACCDGCGRHEIIAVESPGVAIDLDTQVVIAGIEHGNDECDLCMHEIKPEKEGEDPDDVFEKPEGADDE